jgi:hypothetical protein
MPQSIQIYQMNADEAFKMLKMAASDKTCKVVFNIGVVTLPEHVTTQEAMDLIQCSRDHLRRLVEKRVLKKVKSAVGQLRYDRDEIINAINAGLV